MNKLINDDCMNYLPTIPDKSIQLVLTDIPYGVVNRTSNGLRNLDKGKADEDDGLDLDQLLKELVRVCSGSIYIFCGTEQVSFIRGYLSNHGTTRLCIWQKKNPSPMNGQHIWLSGIECCVYLKFKGGTFNEHCKNPVWVYPTVKSKIHPTQKPVDLFKYLIEVSSNEGDTILDVMAGSGTAGVAAKSLGRNFILIEKNEEFFCKMKERINEPT